MCFLEGQCYSLYRLWRKWICVIYFSHSLACMSYGCMSSLRLCNKWPLQITPRLLFHTFIRRLVRVWVVHWLPLTYWLSYIRNAAINLMWNNGGNLATSWHGSTIPQAQVFSGYYECNKRHITHKAEHLDQNMPFNGVYNSKLLKLESHH